MPVLSHPLICTHTCTHAQRSKVGDILVQGERGAQALCHPDIAPYLCASLSSVRTVTVSVQTIPASELKVSIS